MNTVLVIISFCALVAVNGQLSPNEQLKNDYVAPRTATGRLAGWISGPKTGKCDMVRRNIKTFGYCWEDENAQRGINTYNERGWVRDVIRQWEKCGGMRFVEESRCRNGSDFITIKVGDYHPTVYPSIDDRTSDCKISGFTMYTTFYTFGEKLKERQNVMPTEKIRESNIRMYTLHEFGHFLGFDHEQNRNDRGECEFNVDATQVGHQAAYGNYEITSEYDNDSIMNYCRVNSWFKPYLSELDKRGVWQTYGGGNWDECQRVTKPWKWYPGDGLDEDTMKEVNRGPTTPGCKDDANWCGNFLARCDEASIKHTCKKTCGVCW